MSHRRARFLGALLVAGLAGPSAAHAASSTTVGAPFAAQPLHAAAASRLQATVPAPIAAPTPITKTGTKLRKSKSFSLALGATLNGTNVKLLAARDLVVVDGDDTSKAAVKRLRAKGAIVLGYLSVGSVESWRPWFDLLRDYRLEPLGDWDGERYADVSKPEVRTALTDTIAPKLLAKGFDGLFLDNVDMVDTHPEQAAGMLELVKALSAEVRGGGGALMAQNGDGVIGPYLPYLDGWNREDPTGTYDFASEKYVATEATGRRSARLAIQAVRAAGVLATTTDYFASPTSKAAIRAVRIACKAGAVPFVGDIDLKKITSKPQRC